MVTAGLTLAVGVTAPRSARADTLGYPDSDAVPCAQQYGPSSWCKGGTWLSARTYGYRNCTDYVAWRLELMGVDPSKTRNLGHAKFWASRAAARGLTVRATPTAGAVAVSESGDWGHVAFVESVNVDGSITVAEYNADWAGVGRQWTGVPASRGFTHFVTFTAEQLLPVVDETQVILNHAGEVWARNTVGSEGWAREADAGSAVDVASGGDVQVILDHAGQVWAQEGIGRAWVAETSPSSAVEVEVGSDGTQMIRDHASRVWAKETVGWGGWIPLTDAGSAKDIETNGGVHVIRDYADQIYIRSGSLASGYWWAASDPYAARELEVGSDGSIMVRNYVDEVWTRKSAGWVRETNAGSAAQIANNGGVRVVLNHAGELWHKGGAPGLDGWQLEAGHNSAKNIEVIDDGTQVLLDFADAVYARGTRPGDGWTQETGPGAAKSIAD